MVLEITAPVVFYLAADDSNFLWQLAVFLNRKIGKGMRKWNFVWKAYMEECTRLKLARDVFGSVGLVYKLILLISLVMFFVFAVFSFYAQFALGSLEGMLSFFGLAFFEIIFIVCSECARKHYMEEEFSQGERDNAPPEKKNHQDSRYLKFRKGLSSVGVDANEIDGIFEILEVRIEMENSGGIYTKGFLGFIGALMIASYSASINFLGDGEAFGVILFALIVGVFAYFILSLVPSELERMKELKYFLALYQKEVSLVERSQDVEIV